MNFAVEYRPLTLQNYFHFHKLPTTRKGIHLNNKLLWHTLISHISSQKWAKHTSQKLCIFLTLATAFVDVFVSLLQCGLASFAALINKLYIRAAQLIVF